MTRPLRQWRAIVAKDVRIELRTMDTVVTGGLFALVVVTMFLFSGFGETADVRRAAPGVLWVTTAFLGTIVFARTFQRERESGALAGMLLAPRIAGPLFAAKLTTNLLLLGVVETLLVPAVALVFGVAPRTWAGVVLVVALGSAGLASLGTVLAAALSAQRMREVLLPVVLYPLALPLLLASVKATAAFIGEDPAGEWVAVVVAFDVLFLVIGRWLFGQAIEGSA